MALPRNDSLSIISSLQMDYGDSDEEENDSKNNSHADNVDDSETKVDVKTEPVTENLSSSSNVDNGSEQNLDKDSVDVRSEQDIKSEQPEVSPVDFISDDEDDNDSQKEERRHHHHRHHHHHHKGRRHSGHGREEEEQRKHSDMISDTLNTDSPASQSSVKLNSKKATSLVSYGRDDVGSDEESEEEDAGSNDDSPILNASDASILSRSVQNMAKDDIKIPPEPPGKCPYPLQRKIELEYERMMREGVDHNRIMQEKKNFRNPSIYEKLIEFCHIDENGTNFPPEIYNPHLWGKDSLYDELDKAQRKDMERREKEKKDRTKIEFLTGTKKPVGQSDNMMGGPDEKKRKTKWDAQPGNIQIQYAKLPASQQNPGVVNLTAAATGTKGKVISAVGSLSKKSSSSSK